MTELDPEKRDKEHGKEPREERGQDLLEESDREPAGRSSRAPDSGDSTAYDLLDSLDRRLAESGLDPLIALTEIVAGNPGHSGTMGLHGRQFGGARVERVLGAGGMGVTYMGVLADGTKVAVKVLRQVGAEQRERFENECAILSTLEHESIVRYHSHGFADDGRAFLVMELVEGRTLEQVLIEIDDATQELSQPAIAVCGGGRPVSRTDPSWLRRIATFGRRIADALAHAHERGVVHRDVKPANIIVRGDGTPVLVDFGLGRDLGREVSMTRTGAVIGTVGWMAPEQFDSSGGRVGPGTDVYALGLLLYRLWTGRDLRLDLDDIVRFRSGPLRLSRAESSGLDLATLGVLYGCLEPEPGRRYRDARELADDLQAISEGRDPTRHAPGRIGRFLRRDGVRRWSRAAVAAAVLGIGFLAWAMWPGPKSVYVLSIEDDQQGVVADRDTGEGIGLGVPIYNWRTSRSGVGRFLLTNRSVIDMPFEVNFDAATPSQVLLTVPLDVRSSAANGSRQIDHRGLIDFGTYDPAIDAIEIEGADYVVVPTNPNQLWPDHPTSQGDEVLKPRGVRVLAAPGHRSIALLSKSQVVERREVTVLDQQVAMLSGFCETYGFDGAFHECVGTIVGPLPEWCSMDLSGSAIRWLDSTGQTLDTVPLAGTRPRAIPFTNRNSSIVPASPDEWAVVELRLRFSEPMRSMLVVFHHRLGRPEGAEFLLRWRTSEGSWTDHPVGRFMDPARSWSSPVIPGGFNAWNDYTTVIDVSDLPLPGSSELFIEIRMRDPRTAREVAYTRAFESYILGDRPSNALEVVADPSPEPRRFR